MSEQTNILLDYVREIEGWLHSKNGRLREIRETKKKIDVAANSDTIDRRTAARMRTINDYRNQLVHTRKELSDKEWLDVRTQYELLELGA